MNDNVLKMQPKANYAKGAAESAACSTRGPLWASDRGTDHLKGFQDWVMTRCVVVLGLLCVEMCLVQSWFGLRSFFCFKSCTSVLLLFVALVCLSVDFKLLLRLYLFPFCVFYSFLFFGNIEFLHTSPHPHLPPPDFLAPTHTPAHTTTPHNLTSLPVKSLSLLYPECVSGRWLWFLFSCSHGKPVSKQRALTVKQTA